MPIRRAIGLGLWLVLGAASGTAVYVGDPILVLPGVLLLAVAVVATTSRRVLIALPAYLVGSGLTGLVLTSTLSPNGAFSIGTSGHSAVCSSAGGCLGQVVTQSAFSVPAVAVYAVVLAIGAIWFGFLMVRPHHTDGPPMRHHRFQL